MKKTSRSKSAFLQPRVLLSFALAAIGLILAVIGFTLSSGASALAQKPKSDQPVAGAPQVIQMVGPVSQDLDLRALPFIANEGEEDEVRLMRHPTHTSNGQEDAIQAVRQSAIVPTMPAPIATYAGINSVQSGCGCLPPDTHGDVG